MSGINKVILVGNLGKNPEIRTLENGGKKANFSLATTEVYKDKNGQKVSLTEWHNIVCWRRLAEIAEQYLEKGKQIYLEGKIRTRSWEDNGVKKYITEIVADTFTMLNGAMKPEEQSAPPAMPEAPPASADYEDDLPF